MYVGSEVRGDLLKVLSHGVWLIYNLRAPQLLDTDLFLNLPLPLDRM